MKCAMSGAELPEMRADWLGDNCPWIVCPLCATPRQMNHGCSGCARRTLPGRVTRWARQITPAERQSDGSLYLAYVETAAPPVAARRAFIDMCTDAVPSRGEAESAALELDRRAGRYA